MRQVKIIVEKHPDGYVAYSLSVKGVVVGEGESYDAHKPGYRERAFSPAYDWS